MSDKVDNIISFGSVKWLLLFVFYLQFLVPELIIDNWSLVSASEPPNYFLIAMIQLFAVALPCAVYMFLNSAKPTDVFKLNKISKTASFVFVLIGISAQSIASLLNIPALMLINSKLGMVPTVSVGTPDSPCGLAIGIFVIALMPAIFEECLMRGIVLTATEHIGYRASLFIGGLFFALLHNRIDGFLGIFFLGVVLCYVVWMTGSIFAGMIVHFSFNAFGMILDYIINSQGLAHPWLSGVIFQSSIILISIIIFSALIGTIKSKKVKRYKTQSLFKELFFAIFNLPMLLVIAGYIMFEYTRLISLH